MQRNLVSNDYINMYLKQMGAESISRINSYMNIVKFRLFNDVTVSYVFNITKHNKYYLQRMEPYAMTRGKFSTSNELIDFIASDIAKFRNASRSSNFDRFVKLAQDDNSALSLIEQLFLTRNVDPQTLDDLTGDIEELKGKVRKALDQTAKVDDYEVCIERNMNIIHGKKDD